MATSTSVATPGVRVPPIGEAGFSTSAAVLPGHVALRTHPECRTAMNSPALHADRGGPMKAKATAFLLADLGATRSHNRPHTSNDNPFSESHFKTLKYQPRFPRRFGCIEDAKAFCRQFFDW